VGPAALNLRYLRKRRVPTAMAVTTVTLMQISQALITVILLLLVMVIAGSSLSVSVPYGTILGVVAVVMVLTALSWHVGRGPKPAARRIQGSFRAGGERNRGRLRVSPDRRGAHPTTTIEP